MNPRDIAEKLAPRVTSEITENEDYIKDNIAQGGIKRFVLNRAWPTLIGEITNTLEAVIQLVAKEFSKVPLGKVFERIGEIERDPRGFAVSTAKDMEAILESMRGQFVRDAGGAGKRLLLGVCWNPLIERIPDGVEWGLSHVLTEMKGHPEWELASLASKA